MNEPEYENITRAQLTDPEFKQYIELLAEQNANAEALNTCIDKLRREMKKNSLKKNEWWQKMSAKYGFGMTSGVNIDNASRQIMEMVPKQEAYIREADELTRTDPDKIDDHHTDGCCKSDCEPQPEGETPQ